jgi:spermidine synthase
MTLKVEKVLHHEKSQYQDVLIFKSTDYGTVLVLDNVIQCTERDEFSYQEMIAHLAMNSHPDPKKVLVIGGGDGGVLREVVKHDCVEEAVLCDIDEAVIRLSKEYLPHMAQGLTHPKSTVHVGDGFKFLDDYKNSFDVIITDSSDPDGPAESLFQKSYFELLNNALREGGVITTQGCTFPFFPSTWKAVFEGSLGIGGLLDDWGGKEEHHRPDSFLFFVLFLEVSGLGVLLFSLFARLVLPFVGYTPSSYLGIDRSECCFPRLCAW